jgi:hypothetical protein
MFRTIASLLSGTPRPAASRPAPRRTSLGLETLEDRCVPSASNMINLAPAAIPLGNNGLMKIDPGPVNSPSLVTGLETAALNQLNGLMKMTSNMAQVVANVNSALNDAVLSFAVANLGTQVGDGQCWTLVDQALKAAGADTSGDAACIWGNPIGLNALAPGDVLQFENVHFQGATAGGGWYWQDFPHHTAIVYAVNGSQITLLNQNVNGDMTVQFTTINLDDWQSGTISAYEPQLPS